jgi:hypothetical protein
LFPGFSETYAHPKLKKMLKTKLKCVIPIFFSCLAKILAARTERSFLLGWSDPRLTLATEPCAKVGSLQPNTVPLRGHFSHSAVRNFLLLGHLLARQGDREGDGWGDLCLSCTRHLSALLKAVEALRHRRGLYY